MSKSGSKPIYKTYFRLINQEFMVIIYDRELQYLRFLFDCNYPACPNKYFIKSALSIQNNMKINYLFFSNSYREFMVVRTLSPMQDPICQTWLPRPCMPGNYPQDPQSPSLHKDCTGSYPNHSSNLHNS